MKGKKKNDGAPADPSGLRAVGAKLAEDEAKAKQSKLVLDARDIAITREEVELPRSLSETEVAHAQAQVMQLEGEIDELTREKERLAKEASEKAKEITKRRKDVSKLAQQSRTRTEMLLTGVRVEHDFQAAQVRYYRLDRGPRDEGELYDTKAMPPEERERAIFTPPKDAERVVVEEKPAVNAKGDES